MITIITWLWKTTGWRNGYNASHVNALERMVSSNLSIPHIFKCITDMPEGINCETIPLWENPPTNTHPTRPNCFRRLKAFSEEMRPLLGDRFLSLDLDCVILGDITPIVNRSEDFLILEGSAAPYNGSMWMMNTGCRKHVYEQFHPIESPNVANRQIAPNGKRFHGSDQAWISYKIPGEKTWGKQDGIYQYVYDIKNHSSLPENAKIVFYAGGEKPWSSPNFTKLQHVYNQYAA
jgi:hypothetical protein